MLPRQITSSACSSILETAVSEFFSFCTSTGMTSVSRRNFSFEAVEPSSVVFLQEKLTPSHVLRSGKADRVIAFTLSLCSAGFGTKSSAVSISEYLWSSRCIRNFRWCDGHIKYSEYIAPMESSRFCGLGGEANIKTRFVSGVTCS